MIDIKQKIFRYLYNNLKPSDIEKKEEIIKKLFAKTGNQIIVEQNFDNKNHKIIHVFKIYIIFLIFYTCSLKIYKKYDILYIWRKKYEIRNVTI